MNWDDYLNSISQYKKPSLWLIDQYTNGNLEKYLPEVHKLFGVPQPELHHPEIDTGVHIAMVMDQIYKRSKNYQYVFVGMLHDLGKGLTDKNLWPKHVDHEETGVPLVKDVCQRMNVPTQIEEASILVCREHLNCHRVMERNPSSLIKWITKNNLTNTDILDIFSIACYGDATGRKNKTDNTYEQEIFLKGIIEHIKDDLTNMPLSDQVSKEYQKYIQTLVSKIKLYKKSFINTSNNHYC